MALIKKITLSNTTYDLGADANNIAYNSNNSVKDKIDGYDEIVPSSASSSNKLATMNDIPSLTNYIEKSQTTGLVKNDGSIDTTTLGKISTIESEIPSTASSSNKLATAGDIPDVSNFITKAVNDLTYYYTSSNTYTKTEVDNLITAAKNGRFIVVVSLPTTDIDTKAIYLVPKSTAQTNNVYDEYINTDGTSAGWEKIGDTQIDLSNYVQKSSTSGLIKNDGTIDTTTYISDISGKTDKVTNAINGNFAGLDSNGNLTDSGSKASDFLTSHQDISGKADKVTSATSGNLAGLNASGNLTDSGYAITASTTDLEDGVSQLTTGTIYLVYET